MGEEQFRKKVTWSTFYPICPIHQRHSCLQHTSALHTSTDPRHASCLTGARRILLPTVSPQLQSQHLTELDDQLLTVPVVHIPLHATPGRALDVQPLIVDKIAFLRL